MKTYTTIHYKDIPYHYRISGNRYGWKLSVINDAMLNPKLWASAGKKVKYPIWELPIDKQERQHFIHETVTDLIIKYL